MNSESKKRYHGQRDISTFKREDWDPQIRGIPWSDNLDGDVVPLSPGTGGSGSGGVGSPGVGATVVSHGAMGAAETFDFNDGTDHEGTLDENLTVTLDGASDGEAAFMTLVLTQDSGGGNTIDLPSSVVNEAEIEAAFSTDANAVNVLTVFSYDGGTVWYAFLAGGSAASEAAAQSHILLADGRSTPFAFEDLLQMDDGSDFMWSDPE